MNECDDMSVCVYASPPDLSPQQERPAEVSWGSWGLGARGMIACVVVKHVQRILFW